MTCSVKVVSSAWRLVRTTARSRSTATSWCSTRMHCPAIDATTETTPGSQRSTSSVSLKHHGQFAPAREISVVTVLPWAVTTRARG